MCVRMYVCKDAHVHITVCPVTHALDFEASFVRVFHPGKGTKETPINLHQP